jgi:hypothetical protein
VPVDLSRLYDEADPNYPLWIESVLAKTVTIFERAQKEV